MLIRFLLILALWFLPFVIYADDNFSTRPEVIAFINQMVKQYQFNKPELIALFKAVKVRPKVIQHIKAPLEQSTWRTYQMMFVTETRIRQGVEFWSKYHEALERAEKTYGVPASIIVATMGVETKYGRNTGDYRVIDALVNLGFGYSPRAKFFRNELKEFLLLSREQHLDPLKVMGSYAGAIGQPQFMPSSYRYYAINFSGSGKTDLSHNVVDVIGSIANYYHKHGWKTNQAVAIPASLQGGRYQLHLTRAGSISHSELVQSGLVQRNYLNDKNYKLIELQGYYGREFWLGFHNFDVIKRYNPSDLYAMAVYQLSYYISVLREKLHNA